ncbi:MAG TPA: oxidoreductase, partial [Armatimonadetes bacterium]|nr:oxidoreductase [Armatimonadota bacterium]
MNVVTVLLGAMALLVVGAVVTALLAKQRRRCGWVAFAFVFPACLGAFYVALQVFAQGEALGRPIVSLRDFGLNASLQLRVDELSAVFLMITSLIATCATLYSVRYVLFYEGENLVRYYPLLLLFIASIMGVVGVADMFFFIVFWELMTLTSYVLVVYERQEPANLRAGIRYFLATHIATGCMILATIVLYVNTPLRSFEFASLRQGVENLLATNPALAHLALLLFFVGFATKAGVLPFGFWLPDAYPAAPSGASAAFAGTMTKLGVYGIVRVFVEILPLSHASTVWGEIIAIFGTLSIFIGTVTALVQSDSKRLLSFHIIGQVGYMLLGVGTGICFLRLNPALATVALMSGL